MSAAAKTVPPQTPEEMFERNARLATFFAKRWLPSFPESMRDDVFAEARLGLWIACLTYDPNRGTTFSTYASNVIYNQLRMMYRKMKKDAATISLDAEVQGPKSGDPRPLHEYIPSHDRALERVEDRCLIEVLPPLLKQVVLEGKSQRQLSKEYGVSQPQISRRLKAEREKIVRALFEGR